MKKWLICLVLGLLLVSAACIVQAQRNTQVSGLLDDENATIDNNETEPENNETDRNETDAGRGNETANRTQVERMVQTMTRTRIQNRTNLTFSPWQKRNESECMESCTCLGAVVTCPTENGRMMTIQAGRSGNIIVITVERVNVSTELELELENESENNIARLRARLRNGETRPVRVLPDEAAERARERLRIRECNADSNCTLQLGEENGQLRYEMQIERHSRILGIFQKKMRVRAEIDAEDGELRVRKPWWAFLAVEPEE